MQKMPFKSFWTWLILESIHSISRYRVAQISKVRSDLVFSAGLWRNLEQSIVLVSFQYFILGNGGSFSVRSGFLRKINFLLFPVFWRTSYQGFYCPRFIFQTTYNQRDIFFFNRSVLKLFLQFDKRFVVFSYQQNTGSVFI